ncbi:NAD(P)H-dependent oxidoreductase [Hymenobacter cellulosivorans]|uniref:NAD(P)H-dependent oxidoreductase n=1 Tax=Hymenobacter cellulosivorans TaxID=2932249 RepID=A0ABY4F673_9BACT|nr:NAD(P)H-dependent oxidoreductase [Hymenobacter cellulosivorans]UOQ51612.1 NAD(P)H-dependent oxidoreductase [Hymenobacter cellulosivorans]
MGAAVSKIQSTSSTYLLAAAIAPHNALTEQLLAADILILAHPLHNFSLPGPVKLWLDAVLQKGKAFDYRPEQVGLLQGKKALALYSSAGLYEGNQYAYRDTLPATYNAIFSYTEVGEYEIVGANRTVALGAAAEAQALRNAEARLTTIGRRWYVDRVK